jgi:hypothetical protein
VKELLFSLISISIYESSFSFLGGGFHLKEEKKKIRKRQKEKPKKKKPS